MPTSVLLIGALCVAAATVAAVAGALLVNRFHPAVKRQENNEVTGMLFSIIGVIYAILLTFVTIAVWETSNEADQSSRVEARLLVEIDRYANSLGHPTGTALHGQARQYVDTVVNREWPKLAEGAPISGDGAALLDRMWTTVDGVRPDGEGGAARQAEARADLRALGEARDTRLASGDQGLPAVIWCALIVCAVLAVVNGMMFGVPGRGSYLTMVAILAAVSALLLYTVYQLEYPYQRGERVTAETFVSVVGGLAH